MGAVKNLFVRIGVDARAAVKGFKDASGAGASAEKSIKKSSAQTKQSIREAFASSVPSIKEYTAQVTRTRSAHETATQNVSRLQEEVSRLTSIYDTVKNATSGLDLYKPLSELMVDAEKSLTIIESKRRKLEAELSNLTSDPKTANSKKTAALQAELTQLAEKSRYAQARMADLDRVADAVGNSNIGYASAKGLEQLQQEITATQNQLRTTQMVVDETGRSLKSMGSTAAYAVRHGVVKLGSGLKGLASAAGRGITSLPGKLRNIGRSANASTGGLTRMVRSIRNIGIASLGMRAVGLVFGELRSIITDYLNQNEELNQSIKTMKSQLGEALAPAINIVIVAMQRLMPVVTAVSNGINSIFKTLFGDIAATSKKIESTASELNTYGFDQITKDTDTKSAAASSASAQAGEQSALVTRLTKWLKRLKAAFVSGDWKALGDTLAGGINSVFAEIDKIDVGKKLGGFINSVTATFHGMFSGVDFKGIGQLAGRELTDAFSVIDWNVVGKTLGLAIIAIPALLVGFTTETDWLVVGKAVSDALKPALRVTTDWLQNTDWLQLGASITDLIAGVDWSGIASEIYMLFGSAIVGGTGILTGFLDRAVDYVMDYFSKSIEEASGDVTKGILNALAGILEGMINNLIESLLLPMKAIYDPIAAVGRALGLDMSSMTIPKVTLPRAARGTIVSKATDLTVGEDGTEAIMPLEKHTEWLDVLAAKLTAKMPGPTGGGGGRPVTFQFYLANRKITEYTIKDINQITREDGVCPIRL